MSNHISIRRVMIQTLDEQGRPEGEPTYGIMAADSYEQAYDDTYESFGDLEDAIQAAGSILACLAGPDKFTDLRKEDFGTGNYYGPIHYGDDGLAGT